MSLPALRLSALSRWSCREDVTRGLRGQLLGHVLVLPTALSESERAEVIDLLTLFLDLRVEAVGAATSPREPDHIYVHVLTAERAPDAVVGSLVVCAMRRSVSDGYLDLPQEVMTLRDVVIECLGREHSGTRLQRIAAWAGGVTDSPSTALRFADGAMTRALAVPESRDVELYRVGLAAAVGGLLRGVDVRVAQWVLALVSGARSPGRLVDTDAALLGQTVALQRAFEAGLVHALATEPGESLELRRPLDAIGHLDEAPDTLTLRELVVAMEPYVTPQVLVVLQRALRTDRAPLGLDGPEPPKVLFGREEVVARLVALLEPAQEVRTCVLHGMADTGKTAVAAKVAEVLRPQLEPAWVYFTEGALKGWLSVATAIGVDPNRPGADARDAEGVPRWVRDIHAALKERPCLLIVDDADGVPEAELPAWLPTGAGECSVLVLGRGSQRPLQRTHDAVAVLLPSLDVENARRLLTARVTRLEDAIARGEADRLIARVSAHPGALVLLADVLDREGIDGAETSLDGDDKAVTQVVDHTLASLPDDERRVLDALAICAPAGSPPELPLAIADKQGDQEPLHRLVDLALVARRSQRVVLQELVRLAAMRDLRPQEDAYKALEMRHAREVSRLCEEARARGDELTRDALYEDLLLAAERMIERGVGLDVAMLVAGLGFELREYPRGEDSRKFRLAIRCFEAALQVYTEQGQSAEWAWLQGHLGIAWWRLPTGDRASNLTQAVACLEGALRVYTERDHPAEWAMTQNNLGIVYRALPVGDRTANLSRAIGCFEAALRVRTQQDRPVDWAMTQNNLGLVYRDLPTGDRAANLARAIEHFENALPVYSERDRPDNWAITQNNLGNVYRALPSGDRAVNFARATECFENALRVYTERDRPDDWAWTQNNLGSVYLDPPTGDRDANVTRAIACFEAALRVWTEHERPLDWAVTQNNLGLAYAALPTGDRAANLTRAIACHEAALRVHTEKDFPREFAVCTRNLDTARQALAALDTKDR